MAAPVPTDRQTPTGRMLEDGYQHLVTFALAPDVALWEKTVQRPGVDMEDPIPISTMHNEKVRTFALRQLRTVGELTMVCSYDPADESTIDMMQGTPTTITLTDSAGGQLAFYGGLQSR